MAARFLRCPEVRQRVPWAKSTFYLKISRHEFPAPYRLGGRSVAWLESEIDEWIRSRVAMNNQEEVQAR